VTKCSPGLALASIPSRGILNTTHMQSSSMLSRVFRSVVERAELIEPSNRLRRLFGTVYDAVQKATIV
jgi:hypothetical protein